MFIYLKCLLMIQNVFIFWHATSVKNVEYLIEWIWCGIVWCLFMSLQILCLYFRLHFNLSRSETFFDLFNENNNVYRIITAFFFVHKARHFVTATNTTGKHSIPFVGFLFCFVLGFLQFFILLFYSFFILFYFFFTPRFPVFFSSFFRYLFLFSFYTLTTNSTSPPPPHLFCYSFLSLSLSLSIYIYICFFLSFFLNFSFVMFQPQLRVFIYSPGEFPLLQPFFPLCRFPSPTLTLNHGPRHFDNFRSLHQS